MPRRKKLVKRDLASIGREVIKQEKAENIVAVSGFEIDEAVQYYDDGWRYGHIRELPTKGVNRGRARVEHPVTHRKVWVDGGELKKMEVV
jgi:hypothetical protein